LFSSRNQRWRCWQTRPIRKNAPPPPRIIRQTDLPPAGSEINRQSARRVLQTDFIRLNWPALWWLHLPLWGASGRLVFGLALPWLLLLGWGAWGLRLVTMNNE